MAESSSPIPFSPPNTSDMMLPQHIIYIVQPTISIEDYEFKTLEKPKYGSGTPVKTDYVPRLPEKADYCGHTKTIDRVLLGWYLLLGISVLVSNSSLVYSILFKSSKTLTPALFARSAPKSILDLLLLILSISGLLSLFPLTTVALSFRYRSEMELGKNSKQNTTESIFSASWCGFSAVIFSSTTKINVDVVMFISIFRVMMIRDRLKAVKLFTRRVWWYFVFSTLILSLLLSIAPYIVVKSHSAEFERHIVTCAFKVTSRKTVMVYLLQELPLIIPFLVSLVAVLLLLQTVMLHFRRTRHLQQRDTNSLSGRQKSGPTEYRMIREATKIIAMFILCYGPRVFFTIFDLFEKLFDLKISGFRTKGCFAKWYLLHIIMIFLVTLNNVVNPLLYGSSRALMFSCNMQSQSWASFSVSKIAGSIRRSVARKSSEPTQESETERRTV